jgi:hypothetical protein
MPPRKRTSTVRAASESESEEEEVSSFFLSNSYKSSGRR